MKFNLIKWKLMLTTLPIAIAIVALKYVIVAFLHYEGLVRFADILPLITGSIFLISFMYFGTIWDYKESEKIPAEIACTIESIEDSLHHVKGYEETTDLPKYRAILYAVTDSILKWFRKQETEEVVFERISSITEITLLIDNAGLSTMASRVTNEQHVLRKLFSRVIVVKKTGFLSAGYAFLEVVTVVIVALLLLSEFENELLGLLVVGFVTLIFVYMKHLIRDIDEPFEFSSSGKNMGAADIDLFPLIDYHERAKQRLNG